MHPMLVPPSRRMEGVIRNPYPQHVHASLTQQFQASLMIPDALKRAGTTAKNRTALGPLPSPQQFITVPQGGVNTPSSMNTGSVKMNARRLVSKTPGQSAGMV